MGQKFESELLYEAVQGFVAPSAASEGFIGTEGSVSYVASSINAWLGPPSDPRGLLVRGCRMAPRLALLISNACLINLIDNLETWEISPKNSEFQIHLKVSVIMRPLGPHSRTATKS